MSPPPKILRKDLPRLSPLSRIEAGGWKDTGWAGPGKGAEFTIGLECCRMGLEWCGRGVVWCRMGLVWRVMGLVWCGIVEE